MVDNSHNYNTLTGIVMLETLWDIRHKDLIDLVSPFILYCTAKKYSVGEIIDLRHVLESVRVEFGLADMPQAVVKLAYKRSKSVRKKKGNYRYVIRYDEADEIENRRLRCSSLIENLGERLRVYLDEHCSGKTGKKITHTLESTIDNIIDFFSRFGLFLGIDRLEEHEEMLRRREIDYNIANFIYDAKDKNLPEYENMLELLKGYLLRTAIYFQTGNSDITKTNYRKLTFYYDTPFLLKLLGYKTEEERREAVELHAALAALGGKFRYFPQTEMELYNILTAYAHHLNTGSISHLTLEGLDERKMTVSAVERERELWKARLESSFETTLAGLPEYTKKADGSIDERYVIDEAGFDAYLAEMVKWGKEEGRKADVDSLLAIHKLRNGISSTRMEECKAVFVTTNKDLVRAANRYYSEKVDKDVFPITIADSDLAALTWVKSVSSTEGIPEAILLKNAYMATQPTMEMMEKFAITLQQMQDHGEITEEVALSMRESRFVRKEMLIESFSRDPYRAACSSIEEYEDSFYVDAIREAEEKLREEYSFAAREDERFKARQKEDERKHRIHENAQRMARKEAHDAAERVLRRWKVGIMITSAIILTLAIIGIIKSAWIGQRWMVVPSIILILITILSAYDTVRIRKCFVYKLSVKRSDEEFNRVYKRKVDEYMRVVDDGDLNIDYTKEALAKK